jgi:hypothetical protein
MAVTTECRICKSSDLENAIILGNQKNTSIFPLLKNKDKLKASPITLLLCKNCGLVQLKETTSPDSMYKSGHYGYRSNISNTMRNHLKNYNNEIINKLNPLNEKMGNVVVDIGSNDATFLKNYNNKLRRIGVDPTGNQFKDYYDNMELLPDYFTKESFIEKFGDIKCTIITSTCCFYDLPDPVKFATDIYNLLEDDGIWTCEQSYLLTMLKTNSLDTICHEHLEYYALTQVKKIADMSNLKIIDVKFNSSNGGSFRVYFAKKESKKHNECCQLINKILQEESRYGICDIETYTRFVDSCNIQLNKLKKQIDDVGNRDDIYIYGASTKGNCILQYCNIGPDKVRYAVERNLNKVGRCTSTGIEIISEEQMRKNPPKYMIVLPWHFRKEMIPREKEYLEGGGKFIFYFPTFEIVSKDGIENI